MKVQILDAENVIIIQLIVIRIFVGIQLVVLRCTFVVDLYRSSTVIVVSSIQHRTMCQPCFMLVFSSKMCHAARRRSHSYRFQTERVYPVLAELILN